MKPLVNSCSMMIVSCGKTKLPKQWSPCPVAGVHQVPDRQRRVLPDLPDELGSEPAVTEGLYDQDAILPDDEARVGRRVVGFLHVVGHHREHVRGDFAPLHSHLRRIEGLALLLHLGDLLRSVTYSVRAVSSSPVCYPCRASRGRNRA